MNMDLDNNNFNEENNENLFGKDNAGTTVDNEIPIYDTEFTTENGGNNKHKKEHKKGGRKALLVAAVLVAMVGTGTLSSLVTYKALDSKKGSTTENKTVTYTPISFKDNENGEALTVSEAYEKVKPAVVTVSTTGLSTFNGIYQYESEGFGSGFIINEDGNILTNYHVIENAKSITVTLSDGTEASATVINYDQDNDIAMLKLAEGTKIPGYAELGDSDALYTGQDVLAIGTPVSKDFAQTCTKGIVSAINRNVETSTGTVMNLIQTDTAINPGNSGGPLINTKGEVIGINTMKISSEDVQGIGFAIPINDAKDRIEALSKPILNLGITVREIDEESAKKSGMKAGLYVIGVTEFSPAEKAGLQYKDRIVKFDGTEISTYEELKELKSKKNEGDKVEVVVERDGKNVSLTVELTAE